MSAVEVLNPHALIPCKSPRAEADRKNRAEHRLMEAWRDRGRHGEIDKEGFTLFGVL
jgi:hypothetical protein